MVKNISIGRFFPGDSIVHRLDPRLIKGSNICPNSV